MATRRIALLIALIFVAVGLARPRTTSAVERETRRFWGDEALWDYWAYGDDYLPRHAWKIAAVSGEAVGESTAAKLFDGDERVGYCPSGRDSYEVTIDLGAAYELGGFSLLTLQRPNKAVDSRMARYEFHVGLSRNDHGPAVASGAFDAAEGAETVITFPAVRGQFITLRAFPRDNGTHAVCLRELNLLTADAVTRHAAAAASAADARAKTWAGRDSDEAIHLLGAKFLDGVFCTGDDINRSNLRARPRLEEVGKLKSAGKYADALQAFRDYYFDKLRRPQAFGLHANDVNPFGRGYASLGDFPQGALDKDLDPDRLKRDLASAEALLTGMMRLDNGRSVRIGEPGAVDWWAPAGPYGYTTATRQDYPYRELWWGNGFQPLVTAYLTTKDERYLKRWMAYMDDWASNVDFLTTIHPALNHDNSLYPAVMMIRSFAGIAQSLPYGSDAVSAPAFARIMDKLVHDAPINWIVYLRSNGNGWTPGAGSMLFAILIDEFKVAPFYFREARRRTIEDINVLQMLPDGAETHQWPGYNFLLLLNAGAERLMDARQSLPPWAQPAWERDLQTVGWRREETEALRRRATYALHWGTPSGEYPLVTHQEPPHEKRYKLRESLDRVPSMLDDVTDAQIYSTLYGDGADGIPSYTDDWFPYAGYAIARDGWGRGDGYGSMFCSPRPGCGGVGSGCKNNAFGLAAYGMDLIADDLVHAYVRPTSPIQVDGRRQQFDFNMPKTTWPTGHRGDLVTEWDEPAQTRWLSSANFDLMEGVYSGVWANAYQSRNDFVDGVAHQRTALHARKANLWILTDRMLTKGDAGHDYEQIWWLPLKKRQDSAAFKPEEIVIDAAARTIKTRRKGSDTWWSWDDLRDHTVANVNLSMYQFSDAALAYDSAPQKADEMYDWQRVNVKWAGKGDQQIVTALFPRKPTSPNPNPTGTENDLTKMALLPGMVDADAFAAVTPDGGEVRFASARSPAGGRLALGKVEITGESLLLVTGKDDITGVALGAKAMSVDGKPVAPPSSDFEFSIPPSLDPAKFVFRSIHRPILPVRVLPESDAFADEQEVTLACKTPGVTITYTLDGTDPTPQSARYGAPFRIDRTRVVKARAYRPGETSNPPDTSGTTATPIASALFTKRLASLAEPVDPKTPGLDCAYSEGFWKDLWLAPDAIKPLKQGPVSELFDLSLIPADNAPTGGGPAPRERTYAMHYTGFLKVPADGVYTIRAPHEFTHLDQVPGYELQVYLGHALKPDNNTTKRDGDLEFWYPATRAHAFGTWSVPLKAGCHEFKVVYIDFRTDDGRRMNRGLEGVPPVLWPGARPDLRIAGPGAPEQPIPTAWLWH